MDKENKVFWGSWILISVISIAIMALLTMMPTEITTGVWVPNNAIIANEIDGTYIDISEIQISGTAVTISLEDYKKKHERGNFAKNEIVVDTSGTVHYIGSVRDGMVCTAKVDCPRLIKLTELKQVDIYDSKQGLKIKKIYGPFGVFGLYQSILASILIIVIAVVAAIKISDKYK